MTRARRDSVENHNIGPVSLYQDEWSSSSGALTRLLVHPSILPPSFFPIDLRHLSLESVLYKAEKEDSISRYNPQKLTAIKRTPGGEVDVLLVLLLGDEVRLVLGESSSDSPGLLVTEVERKVYEWQVSC
jgi:hypothetical protein